MVSWRFVWREGLLIDNAVFQISVIELSFLVSFLAYFDSLILCADFVEVPTTMTMTTSFETVDASAGQPTQTLTSEMI